MTVHWALLLDKSPVMMNFLELSVSLFTRYCARRLSPSNGLVGGIVGARRRGAADATPGAAAPPSTAPSAAQSEAAGAIGGVGAGRERAARSDLVARDQVATKQLVEVTRADTISFLDAVRLRGKIRG